MSDLKSQLKAWQKGQNVGTAEKAEAPRPPRGQAAPPASKTNAFKNASQDAPQGLSPDERALFMKAVDGDLKPEEVGPPAMASAPQAQATEQDVFLAAMAHLEGGPGGREPSSPSVPEPRGPQPAPARLVKRVMRGEEKPAFTLDLHGDSADVATDRLVHFLAEMHERGTRLLLVIHGKGEGILANRVERVLDDQDCVAHHFTAPSHLGGAGARVIQLRKAGKGKA
jgi:DNA-nicking Smr family endonuclease